MLDPRGVKWMSRDQLCVYDGVLARALLRNEEGRLVPHSDFFGPPAIALSPREAQTCLARSAHRVIRRHAAGFDYDRWAASVGTSSIWPGAANLLMLEMMRPVLAGPGRSPGFRRELDRLVARRIVAPPSQRSGRLKRVWERYRYVRVIQAEAASAGGTGSEPEDLFDLLVQLEPPISDESLVHLYTGFVFALVSSIGFALAWTILLAVRHGRTDAEPAHLVRESLRLFPVAWLLERRTVDSEEIGGERVAPNQRLAISPYAVHRNPLYWKSPEHFLPERWGDSLQPASWMPFGSGPQSCVAAALSMDVVAGLAGAMLKRPVSIPSREGPPVIGAALAPPRFTLVRHDAAPT